MANMLDYLAWRGDVSFSYSPFNEVDNLILSEMAYVPFEGIVPNPSSGNGISIEDASEIFFSKHTEEEFIELEAGSIAKAPLVLKKAAESQRFSGTKLSCYVNEIDRDTQVQFSAVCFHLPDHTVYVAFRGTDHTIVGWKEDFNMSFLSKTPGQERAAFYLNQIGAFPFRKLRVGGHSKGGNFAVYGSVFCNDKVRKKILAIYSNDGPGFQSEILNQPSYAEMLPKIYSIVPEHTIVGMILENAYSHKIIKSTGIGLMQHDALTWQVCGKEFVEVTQLGEDSKIFSETLRSWLSEIDTDCREEFVDILFNALTYDGAETTEELQISYSKTLNSMRKAIKNLPKEKQGRFMDALMKLAKSFGNVVMDGWRSRDGF